MKSFAVSCFAVGLSAIALAALPVAGRAADDSRVDALLRASGAALGVSALPRLRTLRLRGTGTVAGAPAVVDSSQDLSTQTKGAFADPFVAGNIGAAVRKRFAVTFDYPKQTMTLAPDAAFAARESYDRSGVFITTKGGKIVVADVRPGTPAAAAGLVRGDVLTTIDGHDAAAGGVAAARELFLGAPGTALPLVVTGKDGAVRTVTLTLRDYV